MRYPRNMLGYGENKPKVNWPNGANIAVQFVLNYEEGAESNILHNDKASERFLSEIIGAKAWKKQRHWNMESIYEYGARAGFWRLHDLFVSEDIPITVFGVANALLRSPHQTEAMIKAGWEIASHGLKWIDYKDYSANDERDDLHEAIRLHKGATGKRPKGFYLGRCSINTLDLATEEDGFTYLSDAYDDDLPYWREHWRDAQLIIPYTLDCNDMRFATANGFNNSDQFLTYLKDSFDVLYQEGENGSPKMMSIGLHNRIVGRAGRTKALKEFIKYIKSHDKVWIAKRIDIAEHWIEHHPFERLNIKPSKLAKDDFLSLFGGIYESSEWVAERTFESELAPANDNALGLGFALKMQFRLASEEERLEVLRAHPDLAGKLALANKLTKHSTKEQASAGLDNLSEQELEQFMALNTAYTEKFGFPFIIAVKDYDKKSILQNFEERLENNIEQEFASACKQVERIAQLRLNEILK
ncbi:MAG: allantoinase PuuE [Devosiaceae bacterium]|nr:allantoinase PuuE [Devosiaceae bacterium]